jgi:hypothetical protein
MRLQATRATENHLVVTPAKAGAHLRSGTQWIRAYAGMTGMDG